MNVWHKSGPLPIECMYCGKGVDADGGLIAHEAPACEKFRRMSGAEFAFAMAQHLRKKYPKLAPLVDAIALPRAQA